MTNEMAPADSMRRIQQLEAELEELKQTREHLRAAQEKYRVLVEHANDAIFVLQDNRIQYANPRALELGAIVGEDLDRFPYTEYLHPEDRDKVKARHEKRLNGERVLNTYSFRIVNRKAELFWAEVNAVRIQWNHRPATLNIIRDITSQKLIENQYFQFESLETLRTLSGGLAHSFNNLLMGIQGRLSLLSQAGNQESAIRGHLDGIEQCVSEAAKLTRQMLGFAQAGKYRVTRIAMDEVVEHAIASLDRRHRLVSFLKSFEPDLRGMEGDRQQIEQAVMNVLLNAWQAIPHEGTVVIRLENFDMHEARPEFEKSANHLAAGSWLKLSVRDNGVGMDESVRKRVFEPFFTTKGMGQHRGLGLSSTYGIIANHGGVITIDSTPGYGTTVSIFLPSAGNNSMR
jgi:two-component system, cell cycle sensor histidine kinase and response regulator CckA